MTRYLLLMVRVALVLAACSRGSAGSRIRLNSIRTVILREGHELPANRSAWGPSLGLALHQCISDLECSEGSYCHAPSQGSAPPRCHTCRRRKRRCHRDGMCCPGNRCSNDVCVADAAITSQMIPDPDGGRTAPPRGWRKRGRAEVKGQLGAPCVRSPDCSPGLCCARHFWTRICKPVLQGGQVCTRHRRRKGPPGLELFQRCPCGAALRCRTLRRPGPRSSSSSSSSSMAAAAAKSKYTAPSSSAAKSSSSSKARLHVCQEN